MNPLNPLGAINVFNLLKKPVTSLFNNLTKTKTTNTPVYPTPDGKPITPTTYNSQNMPLLEAKVGPSTVIPSTPKTTETTVPKVTTPVLPTTPKLTSSGATINPSTGGVVQTPTTESTAPSPTPTLPTLPNPLETAVTEAEKTYRSNLNPTAEEIAAEEEMSRLGESFRTAYQNTADQTIPIEFITGQQKSIENRALNLAEPLKDKLARLQAKRTAALESSKFALERADAALKTEKDKTKPTTVSSGESVVQFNPKTGQYETIYTGTKSAGEGFSLSPGQTRYDAFGNPIATAPDQDKITATQSAGKATQEVLDVVDALIGSDTNAISGLPSATAFIPGTAAQKTKNLYDQLKGMLALQNRQQLKGSGAISDFEAKVLERAASSLGRNLSDADFRATLIQLRTDLVKAREQALASGWTPGSTTGGNASGGVINTSLGPINTNW